MPSLYCRKTGKRRLSHCCPCPLWLPVSPYRIKAVLICYLSLQPTLWYFCEKIMLCCDVVSISTEDHRERRMSSRGDPEPTLQGVITTSPPLHSTSTSTSTSPLNSPRCIGQYGSQCGMLHGTVMATDGFVEDLRLAVDYITCNAGACYSEIRCPLSLPSVLLAYRLTS